ncbi:MAG: hypothetical protein KDA22_14070 [Phycisphaerales bacterium]|nr:hypothetical protein [Phycisphaerales bacterium]
MLSAAAAQATLGGNAGCAACVLIGVRIGPSRFDLSPGPCFGSVEGRCADRERLENAHAKIDALRAHAAHLQSRLTEARASAATSAMLLDALCPPNRLAALDPMPRDPRPAACPPPPPPTVVYEPIWVRVGGIFDVMA